jgi:hypothetical protein
LLEQDTVFATTEGREEVSQPTTVLYGDINGRDTLKWLSDDGAEATLDLDPTDSRVAVLVILDGHESAAIGIGTDQADCIIAMLTTAKARRTAAYTRPEVLEMIARVRHQCADDPDARDWATIMLAEYDAQRTGS